MQVVNKYPRIVFLGEDATLMPGHNEVPDAVWSKWKENDLVKHHLRRRKLVANTRSIASLESVKEAQAVEVVKDTYSREQLGKWAKSEKRPAVQKAIEAQLESIRSRKRNPDEENDGGDGDEGSAPDEDAAPAEGEGKGE